jgi:hypothetical protein
LHFARVHLIMLALQSKYQEWCTFHSNGYQQWQSGESTVLSIFNNKTLFNQHNAVPSYALLHVLFFPMVDHDPKIEMGKFRNEQLMTFKLCTVLSRLMK